jgi:23S rRNA pseudouridine1911/1915/1917 synthase
MAGVRLLVGPENTGQRLDQYLARQLPDFSRARLQAWVKQGRILVDGAQAKPAVLLRGGEAIDVSPAEPAPLRAEPEDLPVEILYQDDHLAAINKAAGVVVHAGAGHQRGTLVNRLLHHLGPLAPAGDAFRPGIVHRLDRDTSGVILIAKTGAAHRNLAAQFAARKTQKIYHALVEGVVKDESGRIEKPIARDPKNRLRMTTRVASGRDALTEFRVERRFPRHTLLRVRIGTGRTHQIRVHLASLGHPVAGDALYGARPTPRGRFWLHASRISIVHPDSGEPVTFEAPWPGELRQWLEEI